MTNSVTNKWLIEKKRIEVLIMALDELGSYPINSSIENQFSFILNFFNIVSSFQDSGKIKFVPSKNFKKLRVFEISIFTCSRSPYGVNRSLPGKIVTLDDIWITSLDNSYSYPLAYILRKSNDLQVQLLINNKLQPFVENCRNNILKESQDLIS